MRVRSSRPWHLSSSAAEAASALLSLSGLSQSSRSPDERQHKSHPFAVLGSTASGVSLSARRGRHGRREVSPTCGAWHALTPVASLCPPAPVACRWSDEPCPSRWAHASTTSRAAHEQASSSCLPGTLRREWNASPSGPKAVASCRSARRRDEGDGEQKIVYLGLSFSEDVNVAERIILVLLLEEILGGAGGGKVTQGGGKSLRSDQQNPHAARTSMMNERSI